MRLLWTTAITLGVITAAAPAAGSELLAAIEHAHRAGQIDRVERLAYRIAAVRAPATLPAWLRPEGATALEPASVGSHTQVMVEAFQSLPTLSPAEELKLRNLLAPPPDLTYSVEATEPYPMRVSYGSPGLQAKAERVLQAAITSYELQVQDWGFWEPPIEDGLGSYRFYVMDAGGAAGYTAPYLEVDTTDHYDSYTYIVIDPSLGDVSLDATVAHEFNHACQTAMDVGELRSFMENTASYIEAKVFPSSAPLMAGMFPYFQNQPFRSIEYMRTYETDGYEYGGALWALFLTHHYGDDDPRWLREVWEGSVQSSWHNEPDYFDALDELLASDGGVREAMHTFAEHRFFVGADDDGHHLPHAGNWHGAEVWRTATVDQTRLPIQDAGPSGTDTQPEPGG
ncbi:MAG: hypothetical protein JRI23_06310, partial [Deltaproteobacteria bacterium]|nr:hypothetical protein [Deltaproteobacteria bacterium]MBW2531187.1 hypothetical protein [Deltaproteobacteria bacterium]